MRPRLPCPIYSVTTHVYDCLLLFLKKSYYCFFLYLFLSFNINVFVYFYFFEKKNSLYNSLQNYGVLYG